MGSSLPLSVERSHISIGEYDGDLIQSTIGVVREGKVQQIKYFPLCPAFSDTLYLLDELICKVSCLD